MKTGKIGSDITAKKTSGLNAKDREDFEKFVEERKRKRIKQEDQEEKITGKLPDKEGDASDADLAKQTGELIREKNAANARHDIPIEDIESE
jgi:hypothetical protein